MTAYGHSRLFLRILAFGLVVGFALWCALVLREDLARISLATLWHSWDLVVVAIALSLTNYALRSLRWYWYLKQLGHRLDAGYAALTYVAGFAFTLSPGKLGEVIRAQYYRKAGIPFRDVASAVLIERLLDLFAMVALATLTTSAFPRYSGMVWLVGCVIGAGLILQTLLPWEGIANFFRSTQVAPAVIKRIGSFTAETLTNARPLLTVQATAFGLLVSVAAWGLEGLGVGVLSGMSDAAQVDTTVAIGIYGTAVLVGAVSFLPGGLGSTEAVMSVLLVSQGYPVSDAVLITLTCRFATLWLAVALGWLAILVLHRQFNMYLTLTARSHERA